MFHISKRHWLERTVLGMLANIVRNRYVQVSEQISQSYMYSASLWNRRCITAILTSLCSRRQTIHTFKTYFTLWLFKKRTHLHFKQYSRCRMTTQKSLFSKTLNLMGSNSLLTLVTFCKLETEVSCSLDKFWIYFPNLLEWNTHLPTTVICIQRIEEMALTSSEGDLP